MNVLSAIKHEFLDIYAAIRHLGDDDILRGQVETFSPHFRRLNVLAARDINDDAAEELSQDPELGPVIDHISHLKRLNGLRLEIEHAKAIINSDEPLQKLQDFIYYPNYLELADMEYRGAELGSDDLVVFLGSGPLPLSLICLCNRYRISGIGIERQPGYAAISRQLLNRLGLAEHITIVQGDHFSLPLARPCGLLLVGADAMPKEEIFAHLAATLPEGTRISYRIYEKGLRRLLDTRSTISLPAGLTEYTRIRPCPPVNNTSVFVIKDATPDHRYQTASLLTDMG